MTYLVGVILVMASGYCLASFLKITRGHFVFDLALGWFVGTTYYCVVTSLLVFGAGIPAKATYSVITVIIPMLVMLARIKSYLPSIIASMKKVTSMEYLPENRLSFYACAILLGYSFVVFVMVFFHGASTPIIQDDALHLRAYTPLLAYDNYSTGNDRTLIFVNGLLPSFLPLFFWHLKGEVLRFYINYTVLVSFLCFFIIVYLAPAIRGNIRQGIYGLFFVTSLPLFLIHGTIAYMDAGMAIPYGLGFLFFTFYVRDFDTKDLKTLVLFFIITCMVKEKGIIAGVTGIAITFTAYISISVRKRMSVAKTVITALVLIAIPAFFLYGSNTGLWALRTLKNIPAILDESIIHGLLAPMIGALFYGETLNFSHYPYYVKLFDFSRSLFSSGNFGIIFYVLFATMLINLRSILKGDLLWGFLFWGIVFSETFIYMVILPTNPNDFEDVVHRAVMVLAIISSIYLSSLWVRLSSAIARKD